MLRNEDRMSAHRGLLPVIGYTAGCDPFAHKILGVVSDQVQALLSDIFFVLRLQVKTAAKVRLGQTRKQVTEITVASKWD